MSRTMPWRILIALLPLVAASACGKSAIREEAALAPAPKTAAAPAVALAPTPAPTPVTEDSRPNQGGEAMEPMPSQPPTTPKAVPAPGLRRIHFDFDQAALRPDARDILLANMEYLRVSPSARVRIEGHCDERGTAEYNLALGERRAMNAFQYLVDLGLDAERFHVMSYGKEVPLESGHTETDWEQNRRAEFVELRN